MTPYAVSWLPNAEDPLAEIWLRSANRTAVTAAQSRIDAELAHNPGSKGAELAEGLRRLIVHPLKAFFEIHDAERKVEITAVDEVP